MTFASFNSKTAGGINEWKRKGFSEHHFQATQGSCGLSRRLCAHRPRIRYHQKALSEDQERNRNIRRSNWQAGFSKEWERNATAIANASSQLRQQQPAFVDFCVDKPLMASEIPAGLVLGTEQVSFEKLSCQAPKFISFPLSSALVFHKAMQSRNASCIVSCYGCCRLCQ